MLRGGFSLLDTGDSRWIGPGGQDVSRIGNGWVIARHAYDWSKVGALKPVVLDEGLADLECLETLTPIQLASGMAEAIKHGVITDPAYFELLAGEYRAVLKKDLKILEQVVVRSVQIKAAVVSEDEREANEYMMVCVSRSKSARISCSLGIAAPRSAERPRFAAGSREHGTEARTTSSAWPV